MYLSYLSIHISINSSANYLFIYPYVVMKVEDKAVYDNRKIKNKRTVAAVSPEDKMAALAAMDELRAKGATTEDLVCRLCVPPRPFTAYSTLLTHYRSHAGLRPFECTICQVELLFLVTLLVMVLIKNIFFFIYKLFIVHTGFPKKTPVFSKHENILERW